MLSVLCKQLLLSQRPKCINLQPAIIWNASQKANSSDSYSSKSIREMFLSFYLERNHSFIPSSKVFSADDSSLLFVNAGMNQFKPVILGSSTNNFNIEVVKRAVNSQRCIRAGGKHNDLDEVGTDRSHHTFFEMLGSWSFGDYFKEDACKFAWVFLTEVLKLPKQKLYVTYFNGSDEFELDPDTETKRIWLSLGIPSDRILPFSSKDNFWEMGESGPCGPCTEIHYDTSDNAAFNPSAVNVEGSSIVEIWNLVFMQHNRLHNQKLESLGTYHVDTGMGLERITAIMQGKSSNYDTDLFQPVISKLQEMCGCRAYQGHFGDMDRDGVDAAYRIISDHIRMLTAAITDGVYPGTNGRNLIVRQVLRKAVLCGMNKLNAPPLFLAELVPLVVSSLSCTFPELEKKQPIVTNVLKEAELVFRDVIKHGNNIVDKTVSNMSAQETIFPVGAAITLIFQHGYPKEMLLSEITKRGKQVDTQEIDRFDRERQDQAQRNRGLARRTFDTISKTKVTNQLRSHGCVTTSQLSVSTQPTGICSISSKVVAIVTADGSVFPRSFEWNVIDDEMIYVMLDRSCLSFPPEVKVPDLGQIIIGGQTFRLGRTVSLDDWLLHEVLGTPSADRTLIDASDLVSLNIDADAWQSTIRAYTASRLFIGALKRQFKELTILKNKVEKDQFKLEVTGMCSSDDVTKLQELTMQLIENRNRDEVMNWRDRYTADPEDVVSFCINKCKAHGQSKIVFHCLSGNAATSALINTDQAQAEVAAFLTRLEDDVSSDVDDVVKQIKEIGRLSYKINSSNMLVTVRDSCRAALRKLSSQTNTKLRRLKRDRMTHDDVRSA